MDFRNLYRYFVINKARKLYSRSSGYDLGDGQLNTLIALASLGSVKLLELRYYLDSFHRGLALDVLMRYLKEFIVLGLVDKRGSRYSLSMRGINVLKEIEKKCRLTRYGP